MIRIERDPLPQLAVFTKATVELGNGQKCTRARRELEGAIAFFTNKAHYRRNKKLTKKSFDFKVYKDRALARALETVFARKCAYCESRFAHVTPKDIEHYRPKSEIENRNQARLAPGYYWLAGEWDNLLVACPHCNREHKHEVPGQSAEVNLGKMAQFPLRDEAARVRRHTQDVAAEEPFRLLLDPCSDDPEEHLTFDEEAFVHARKDATDQPSAKGEVSIHAYALQRKELVEERLRVLNQVILGFGQLRYLAVELADKEDDSDVPQHSVERTRVQIERMKEGLKALLGKDAPYRGMTRDYMRKAKAAGDLDDLIRNGIDPQTLME